MWCRPEPSSVSPIYMPGRLRTASRPFNTLMLWAPYSSGAESGVLKASCAIGRYYQSFGLRAGGLILTAGLLMSRPKRGPGMTRSSGRCDMGVLHAEEIGRIAQFGEDG